MKTCSEFWYLSFLIEKLNKCWIFGFNMNLQGSGR